MARRNLDRTDPLSGKNAGSIEAVTHSAVAAARLNAFGKRQFQLADALRAPIFNHENPLWAIFGCLRYVEYHNLCLCRGIQKPHHYEFAADDHNPRQSLS